MSKYVITVGNVYGRWVVLSGPSYRGTNPYWSCRCECGREVQVSQGSLGGGRSKGCRSCGGRRTDTCRRFSYLPRRVYYKLKHIVEHALWRCNDHTHPQYKDYGGRGIKVTFVDESSFIDHLLTLPGYDDDSLVLDRIDNNGQYEAGNLRFVTRLESSRNRRPYTTPGKRKKV